MTIQTVRIELGDTSELPVMSDEEITYFLAKNNWNIQRSCLDVAKTMLLKLSMISDQSVDIFSIRGSAAAKQYMQALKMYISDPNLNQALQNVQGYASGISKADMVANDSNADNNIVNQPTSETFTYRPSSFGI
jgi:hypothetical protein